MPKYEVTVESTTREVFRVEAPSKEVAGDTYPGSQRINSVPLDSKVIKIKRVDDEEFIAIKDALNEFIRKANDYMEKTNDREEMERILNETVGPAVWMSSTAECVVADLNYNMGIENWREEGSLIWPKNGLREAK